MRRSHPMTTMLALTAPHAPGIGKENRAYTRFTPLSQPSRGRAQRPRASDSHRLSITRADRRARRFEPAGSVVTMKILRTAALAGLAKKAYDEARKPHNQEKIRRATDKVKAEVKKRRR